MAIISTSHVAHTINTPRKGACSQAPKPDMQPKSGSMELRNPLERQAGANRNSFFINNFLPWILDPISLFHNCLSHLLIPTEKLSCISVLT